MHFAGDVISGSAEARERCMLGDALQRCSILNSLSWRASRILDTLISKKTARLVSRGVGYGAHLHAVPTESQVARAQTTQTNIGKKVAVARALGERELLCQKVTFMCHK